MTGSGPPGLAAVHDRLRDIFRRNRGPFTITSDSDAGLTLEMPEHEGQPWGYIGGTRLGKRYVSYYLMTVYAQPGLAASMSPELKRRMQGKSCFNFAKVDDELFAELEDLTRRTLPGHAAAVASALAARHR